MTERNKKLIREYLGAINAKPKPKHVVDQYVSDQDYELKQHIEIFEAAFPCYALHILAMIGEGDKVTVRFLFQGTHQGEFMGVPPSGNKIRLEGIIIYQIQDEKIINHWINADMADLMRQLQPVEEEVLV